MKKKHQTLIIVGLAAVAAGLVVHEILKDNNARKRLSKIAEEGYETALDILFPEKEIKNRKVHFGPVIPDA